MAGIPIYKGKKINRFLCAGMAVASAVLCAAAGVLRLAGKEGLSYGLFVLALITGGFALFYGLFWAIWAKREKSAQQALQRMAEQKSAAQEANPLDYQEFVLPKEALTETAFLRFANGFKWTAYVALGIFALMTGSMMRSSSFGGVRQALAILCFCLVITIPGLIVQWVIYRRYEKAVPRRIVLFPGKLAIDGSVFPAQDIREVSASPERIYNVNSPSVFRELKVRTDGGDTNYRIDFRSGSPSGEAPYWEDYPRFLEALSAWGKANGVQVTIEYMD